MSYANQGFTRQELAALRDATVTHQAVRGAVLFDVGDDDPDEFILLDGDVDLVSIDGASRRVSGGSDGARLPLARLRPRQFKAKAVSDVRFLRLTEAAIKDIIHERDAASAGYEVTELLNGEVEDAQDLFIKFVSAVGGNEIRLPSLPAVAEQVRDRLKVAEMGAAQFAKIVNRDASIAAKVVRTANGPLYRGESRSTTLVEAVSRLGIDKTRQLVMSFALKELFQTKVPSLMAKMRDTWSHAQNVAVRAYALARELAGELAEIEPERALLAGLMHDIGGVALLAYAEMFPIVWKDTAILERVLAELKGEAGSMVLGRWGFDDELISLARDVDDWSRSHDSIDLCGIIQLAHFSLLDPAAETEPPTVCRLIDADPEQCRARIAGILSTDPRADGLLGEG